MAYENIQFTIEAAIARLTLNRPDKLNSFNTAMHSEVRDALSQVTQHEARVLVITGAGRGFCAGQDLADRAVAPTGERVDLGESIERNYKPLILGSPHFVGDPRAAENVEAYFAETKRRFQKV